MPFTAGDEIKVNQQIDLEETTSITPNLRDAVVDERQTQSIGMDTAGNIIVTWSARGQEPIVDGEGNPAPEPDFFGVYARRYDVATGLWGDEFLVNQDLPANLDQRAGNQLSSSVAMDDDGDYVITWSSNGFYSIDDQSSYGVYARRFSKDGTSSDQFLVNTNTSQQQSDSSVAIDADGDFVVTWTSRDQDLAGTRGIYAQRYSKDGTPLGTEIPVNTFVTSDQIHSSVAMDAAGNFVVVWESNSQPGDESWGIRAQLFNADGTKKGDEFQVNTYTTSAQRHASVSMDATGNFVIAWESSQGVVEGTEINARRYDQNGTALGDEFNVNVSSSGNQSLPNVKVLKTGGFIVTWTGIDSSGQGIYARQYGANGLPLSGADGDEFVINRVSATNTTSEADNQNFAAVGADGAGNFAFAWTGSQAGSEDVYFRPFTVTTTPNNPPNDIILSANSITLLPGVIPENIAASSVVGLLTTNDPNGDTSFSYEFVPGAAGVDNGAFSIVNNTNNNTFELRINNSPNFEAKPEYSIVVRTTDQGGLSFDEQFIIKVNNLNEAPTDITIDDNTINENVAPNTLVGNLSTIDPDIDDKSFIYTLVTGQPGNDNALFEISGTQLLLKESPNFEAKPSYTVLVQSSDLGGLTVQKALAINVGNLDETPTDITLSNSNINENVPPNSLIGTLSTTDPDDTDGNDIYTYSLAPGGVDNAFFTIVNDPSGATTGELRIVASPDYETKTSYSIVIRSTDGAGLFFDKAFPITVTDLFDPPANLAPTDVNLSPGTLIEENIPAGTAIGTLVSADPNGGDTFTYTLVAGDGDVDNSAFTIGSNGALQIVSATDHELKESYSIRVRTTDQGGLSFEKIITITVNDNNEAPTDIFIQPDNRIDEEVPVGTLVGNLSAADQDEGETFTYQLVGTGNDNAAFTLTPEGALSVNVVTNYETKTSYTIRVRATDDSGAGLTFEKDIPIDIVDVAEPGSPTDLALDDNTIDENLPPNSFVGTFITTDPSAGTFSYTIDPTFGDANSFSISGDQLILIPSANAEAKSNYNIRVQTTNLTTGLSFSKILPVTVNNINEQPTGLTLSPAIINENSPASSIVGSFTTTDPDTTADTFIYSIVGGADAAAFTINGSQLILVDQPNFEVKQFYSIRVRTTDQNGAGLFVEQDVSVEVKDVGDAPTDITLDPASIAENQPIGSIVGTFSTADVDANETFTYSIIGGADAAAFTIVNTDVNGVNVAQLQINVVPDVEAKPVYSLQIRTTDKDGLFFDETIEVAVTGVNEAPLDIKLTPPGIDENSPVGTIVGTLETADSDVGDTFTYTLVDGTVPNDNAAFTLVNTVVEGVNVTQLQINVSPDFETKTSYTIRVRTTDQNGLSFERDLPVAVNNLPEEPGTNPPRDISLSDSEIEENSLPNSVVGEFSTTDPDLNDTFTYTLVAGDGSTDNAAFTIVGNPDNTTARLQINNYPDAETQKSYSIRVRTADSKGLAFEKVFTVTVADLAETPGTTTPRDLQLSDSEVDENSPANTAVGSFITTDPDNNDTFDYTLVAGEGDTDNAAFTIDATGQLLINSIPNFETKQTYTIRVRTTDEGGLFLEKSFLIQVKDFPETPGTTVPQDLLLSDDQIEENSLPNSVVGELSTTDPDNNDEFEYTLVAGEGDTDNAAFTIVNNPDKKTARLQINDYPNAETKPSYTIRVRTTDKGGLTFEEIFNIKVEDLPETPGTTVPRDIQLSNREIEENRPANSLIGNFSTVDPDNGDTFTYTLVAGDGGVDNAAFTIVTTPEGVSELRINSVPNFEAKQNYSIRVRTADSKGLAFEKIFSIAVKDLLERPGDTTPTDLQLSDTTVDENVPAATVIGTLTTDDPDVGDTFTYTLEPGFGDNAAFTIVGDKLQINASPNYETKTSYSIRVTTTDSSNIRSFTKDFTIGVNNLNDPPTVTSSAGGLSYTENSGNVAIDPGIEIADIDSPNLFSATVRIAGYVPGQDFLAVSAPAGLTANFDAATGVLTLSGTASLAAYRDALRSVTYRNSSTAPNTSTRTIQFSVRDEFSTSNLATRTVQITPIDTAPVITTSEGSLAYQENSGEVAVDAGVNVSDPDSPTLSGATVKLVGYDSQQDRLTVITQNGIVSNFDAASGTLTLVGNASTASYQAVLRSIAYLNTSGNPSTAARTVQFSVRSNGLSSNVATRSIQVIPVDSAPVITTSGGGLSYTENAGASAIDPQITIADADSQTLTGATIKLQGYLSGQDSLSVMPANGIQSNFNAATGELTLTGSATVADYQTVLQSVAYTNSSDNPDPAVRTVQFSVRDSAVTSNIATRPIQVLPVNDAPVLQTLLKEVTFVSGSIPLDPQLTVTDVDNARLTGATVTIGNYVRGEDNLLFQDQNGISGNFDPVAGVLRLTGSGAVVSYQTALRSIRYANNKPIATGTPRLLDFQVTDGTASSDLTAGRVQIQFSQLGNVPTVDLNGSGVGVDNNSTFILTGAPVAIVARDARFTNQNYPILTSAQVSISNLLNGADEKLLADTTGTDLVANYNPTNGTLNVTGRGSLEAYLKVLRNVQYQNSNSSADTTTRTILFRVSNGNSASEPSQTKVQISQIKFGDGTINTDGALVTTPATDLINAYDSDDSVISTVGNLQQDDLISGGAGTDTFFLIDGGGLATVDVDKRVNQVGGILTGNTTITNFEAFNFSGFQGMAVMTGSDRLNDNLTGGAGNDVLMGKDGNDLLIGNAGNDQLNGGAGDDQTQGGAGDDQTQGGAGDDLYIVDSPNDLVIEELDAGFDTVQASVNFKLSSNVETLVLTGRASRGNGNDADNTITGNALNNRLTGGAGDDTLVGKNGRDTLLGGAGNDRLVGDQGRDVMIGGKGKDTFVLTSARKGSRETIRDFRSVDDTLVIIRGGFSRSLRVGKIKASQFQLGTEAQDASDRFIYNRSKGALFFDADGLGDTAQVQIARLTNKAALVRSDIIIEV